jgi:hypothetical protein
LLPIAPPSGLPRNPNVLLIRTHPNPAPSVANTYVSLTSCLQYVSPHHAYVSHILLTPISHSCLSLFISHHVNLTFLSLLTSLSYLLLAYLSLLRLLIPLFYVHLACLLLFLLCMNFFLAFDNLSLVSSFLVFTC